MERFFLKSLYYIAIIISILNFNSCKEREETVNCFPNTLINVSLNLNLPAYFNLQNVGGWIYVNEQQAGTRGLIVVKTVSGFLIYDRNSPHICPEDNTTLSVENDIKITCPKDGAEWILITGEPTKIAKIPPKMYHYNFVQNSGILYIFN
jgi:nitrite reductase/ring-hydroxylating ferredoxin subunit